MNIFIVEELLRLKRIAEQAPEGPWKPVRDKERLTCYVTNESGTLDWINTGYVGNSDAYDVANFVAGARNAFPLLIDTLLEVLDEVRDLQDEAETRSDAADMDASRAYADAANRIRIAVRDGLAGRRPAEPSPEEVAADDREETIKQMAIALKNDHPAYRDLSWSDLTESDRQEFLRDAEAELDNKEA